MEKKKPGTNQKSATSSTNIIKRNIENAKNARNKSKENAKPQEKPKPRTRSEKPKKQKVNDLNSNTASNTFEDIKSPIPPNKVSPAKNKQSSTPIVAKDRPHDKAELRERIDENELEHQGNYETGIEIASNEPQLKETCEQELMEKVENQMHESPVREEITVVKASSVKRKRDPNEEEDYLVKSLKKSL